MTEVSCPSAVPNSSLRPLTQLPTAKPCPAPRPPSIVLRPTASCPHALTCFLQIPEVTTSSPLAPPARAPPWGWSLQAGHCDGHRLLPVFLTSEQPRPAWPSSSGLLLAVPHPDTQLGPKVVPAAVAVCQVHGARFRKNDGVHRIQGVHARIIKSWNCRAEGTWPWATWSFVLVQVGVPSGAASQLGPWRHLLRASCPQC